MVGFLNAHGTLPCLFGGEFLDFSLVEDDEIRVGRTSVLDLPDNDNAPHEETAVEEPFDHDFEETFWASLLLGADYDWDDEPEEDPLEWIQNRYADVIRLNDEIGYQGRTAEIIPFTATFIGQTRTNVRDRHWSDKRSLREQSLTYDKRRGKAHAK